MKLNFDFTLVDLDNVPLRDTDGIELHAGRTAAKLLMQSTDSIDVMTKYDWATQLHRTGSIDLDRAGQLAFKKAIESIPNVWIAVRGQILEVLEKRKSETSE